MIDEELRRDLQETLLGLLDDLREKSTYNFGSAHFIYDVLQESAQVSRTLKELEINSFVYLIDRRSSVLENYPHIEDEIIVLQLNFSVENRKI